MPTTKKVCYACCCVTYFFIYCFYITKFIVITSTCLPFWQRELSGKTDSNIFVFSQ